MDILEGFGGEAKENITQKQYTIDGMFCRELQPANEVVRNESILLMHGSYHNGRYWVETPDGRPGWAKLLAKKGFRVVVPDMPGYGYSRGVGGELSGALMVEYMQKILATGKSWNLFSHSTSGPYGWKLLETSSDKIKNLIAVTPGPMGNIQLIPIVQSSNRGVIIQMGNNPFRVTEENLADKQLVRNWFIGQSEKFPGSFRSLRNYIQNYLVATPKNLILERLNHNGSQLKIDENTLNLKTKITIVGPTNDENYSREYLENLVTFWKQKNCPAEVLYLGDHGISGNGHMLMIERNNEEILDLIERKL